MLDKDFDKRIKEKLDKVPVDMKPEAWESFRKLMPVPWYMSFLQNYGGWIFGGVSTAILVFNLVNTYLKKDEFENKTTQVSTVQEPEIKEIVKTEYKTDTVVQYIYITKYKDRYLPNPETSEPIVERDRFREDKSLASEKIVGNKTEDKNTVDSLALKNLFEKKEEQSFAREGSLMKEPKPENLVKSDTTKPADGIKAGKIKKDNFWKKLNVRPGIEGTYAGRKAFSFGPLAEVFIKDRFSATIGVNISRSNQISYKEEKEFNKDTGKNFHDKYRPGKGSGNGGEDKEINDISLSTTRVRMPIYVSYYIPFTYKLNFLISTGTRLDLSASEKVSYTEVNQSNSPYHKENKSYKPKVFNNLYYGMGLQYNRGKFYGQLVPYFEFPFVQPDYIIENNRFGISASLRYSLK